MRADGNLGGPLRAELCLVLQGAKQIMIGDQVLRYDPANYFIATVELPVTGRIIEASAAQPYLGLSSRSTGKASPR